MENLMIVETAVSGDDRGGDEGRIAGEASSTPATLWNDDAFRARVRELARMKGIGLGELARRSGVSEPWLRHPPRKGRNVDYILKTAAALGVSFEHLVRVGAGDKADAQALAEDAAEGWARDAARAWEQSGAGVDAGSAGPAPSNEDVLERLALAWDLAAHTYVALSRRPRFSVNQMTQLIKELTETAADGTQR